MMQLLEHHKREAQKVAQHEFGHFVIGRLCGFETGDISLTLTDFAEGYRAGAEITPSRPCPTLKDVRSYLRDRIVVLMSGALAETLDPNLQRSTPRTVDALESFNKPGPDSEADVRKVAPLLHLLRAIEFSHTDPADLLTIKSELKTVQDELWDRAVQLVEKHSEAIVGLAANLAGRVKGVGLTASIQRSQLDTLSGVQALKSGSEKSQV